MNMYLSAEMMLQEVVWNKLKSTLTMKVTRTRFLNLDMDSKMEFKTGNTKKQIQSSKKLRRSYLPEIRDLNPVIFRSYQLY